MSTSRYLFVCALALIGSFGGGFAARSGAATVHAQAQETTDLRARSFTVLNAQGQPVARLRSNGRGAELMLNGTAGGRVEIDGAGSITIHDSTGRLVWKVPMGGILPATE